MRLNDLLKRILRTRPSAWQKLHTGGAGVDLSGACRVECDACGAAAIVAPAQSHDQQAVLRSDIATTMAWGMECNAEFHEVWATVWPDARASSAYVDVFRHGSLVYSDVFVIVDGGRAYLPMPESADALRVAPAYAALIELLAALTTGLSDYGQYFRRTGMKFANLPWPKI